MSQGGGLISTFFVLILLLSPPGIAAERDKELFDSNKFTKQVMLDIRIAQVTKNPVLTRNMLDYLQEGKITFASDDKENNYLCTDELTFIDEDTLANIAEEVAVAPDDQIKELSSKYYCYRFDILSYFIDKNKNDALKRALDGGFDSYYVSVKNPNPYNKLYLLNQAVFAGNETALQLIASKSPTEDLYLSLLNFITKQDTDMEIINRREKRFGRLKLNYNYLVDAILIDDPYNFAAVNNIIKSRKLKKDNLRQIYLNALKTLIDIRLQSK